MGLLETLSKATSTATEFAAAAGSAVGAGTVEYAGRACQEVRIMAGTATLKVKVEATVRKMTPEQKRDHKLTIAIEGLEKKHTAQCWAIHALSEKTLLRLEKHGLNRETELRCVDDCNQPSKNRTVAKAWELRPRADMIKAKVPYQSKSFLQSWS
jgi:hypothetical protein